MDAQTSRPKRLEPTQYLRLKEAANIMAVSYMWLYMRVGKKGGPPHKRRGGMIVLPRDEFIKWSEQDYIP